MKWAEEAEGTTMLWRLINLGRYHNQKGLRGAPTCKHLFFFFFFYTLQSNEKRKVGKVVTGSKGLWAGLSFEYNPPQLQAQYETHVPINSLTVPPNCYFHFPLLLYYYSSLLLFLFSFSSSTFSVFFFKP